MDGFTMEKNGFEMRYEEGQEGVIGDETVLRETTFLGPYCIGKSCQIGPSLKVGAYWNVGRESLIKLATIGRFCTFGARVIVNPFNHPMLVKPARISVRWQSV
jgi:NDP-sugar pyrophosphorylase family protein